MTDAAGNGYREAGKNLRTAQTGDAGAEDGTWDALRELYIRRAMRSGKGRKEAERELSTIRTPAGYTGA